MRGAEARMPPWDTWAWGLRCPLPPHPFPHTRTLRANLWRGGRGGKAGEGSTGTEHQVRHSPTSASRGMRACAARVCGCGHVCAISLYGCVRVCAARQAAQRPTQVPMYRPRTSTTAARESPPHTARWHGGAVRAQRILTRQNRGGGQAVTVPRRLARARIFEVQTRFGNHAGTRAGGAGAVGDSAPRRGGKELLAEEWENGRGQAAADSTLAAPNGANTTSECQGERGARRGERHAGKRIQVQQPSTAMWRAVGGEKGPQRSRQAQSKERCRGVCQPRDAPMPHLLSRGPPAPPESGAARKHLPFSVA